MAEGTVTEAVRFLERCLKKKGVDVSRIILFGSQTRDEAAQDSDIDLVIISDDFQGKDIFERAMMTKDAEIMTVRKFMIPLDILTLTASEFESETSLIAKYARNGEVL